MKLNNEAVFREEKLEHILNKLSKTIPGEDVTDCTKFLLYGYKDHKIKSIKIIKAAKRNNTSLKVKVWWTPTNSHNPKFTTKKEATQGWKRDKRAQTCPQVALSRRFLHWGARETWNADYERQIINN